jgi:hypothetical protein
MKYKHLLVEVFSSVICDKKYLSNLKENFTVQLLDLHIYMELNVR